VLAAESGARIVGGCCGTSPAHLASIRRALDEREPAPAPSREQIVSQIGPLTNQAPGAVVVRERHRRRHS